MRARAPMSPLSICVSMTTHARHAASLRQRAERPSPSQVTWARPLFARPRWSRRFVNLADLTSWSTMPGNSILTRTFRILRKAAPPDASDEYFRHVLHGAGGDGSLERRGGDRQMHLCYDVQGIEVIGRANV